MCERTDPNRFRVGETVDAAFLIGHTHLGAMLAGELALTIRELALVWRNESLPGRRDAVWGTFVQAFRAFGIAVRCGEADMMMGNTRIIDVEIFPTWMEGNANGPTGVDVSQNEGRAETGG